MRKIVAFWQSHRHLLLPIAGCCLIGWAVFSVSRNDIGSEIHEISCSGGALVTRRSEIASIFARHAEANGLDVALVDCAGSEELLKLVDSGKIDVGFVSGGFMPENYSNIRQLATIGFEPLHLLVKSELVTHSPCDLGILKNRRVEVGRPGSGAYALATEVLAFCGLAAKDAQGNGDYDQVCQGNVELTALARSIQAAGPDRAKELVAELPDAVFLLNPLPSRVAKELIAAAEYDIVPLPFCQSFCINGQHHLGDQHHRIDRRQVAQTVIPASLYRAISPVPLTDCTTLGVPLIVVTHAGLPSAEVSRLIATLYESPFANEMPPVDLLTNNAQFALYPAVTSFLKRRQPFAMRDVVDRVQKVLSVFGAFSAGALAVLSFYRRRKGKSTSEYVSEIGQIERVSWEHVPAIEQELTMDEQDRIKELESQLVRLKQRIVDDYAVGQITGEAAFANLMSLITDTRISLQQASRPSHESQPLHVIPRPQLPPGNARQSAA